MTPEEFKQFTEDELDSIAHQTRIKHFVEFLEDNYGIKIPDQVVQEYIIINTMETTEYIDIRTASELIGVHIGTLYYRIKVGKLIPTKIGITYYLTKSQIDHELERRSEAVQEESQVSNSETDSIEPPRSETDTPVDS